MGDLEQAAVHPLAAMEAAVHMGAQPDESGIGRGTGVPLGPWWNSGASHMNQAFREAYFGRMGLVSLLGTVRRLQRISWTAGCGTARPVV